MQFYIAIGIAGIGPYRLCSMIVTGHCEENYHFPHSDIFFHRKQKLDFYFLDIKKNQSIPFKFLS
jgi:hypothetical protein